MVSWQLFRTLANLVFLRNCAAIALFPDTSESVPPHFTEFLSYLDTLDIDLKSIALSETESIVVISIIYQITIWKYIL